MPTPKQLCQPRGILPAATEFGNALAKLCRRDTNGTVQDGLREACSLEAPTLEAETDELIDFAFADLNRRVWLAGFSPGQRVFGRQLRHPSSLL